MAFPFKGIGRQDDALAGLARIEGGPVDLDSGCPEFAEGLEHIGVVAAGLFDVAAGRDGDVSGLAVEGLARESGEGLAGADFDKKLLGFFRAESHDGAMEAHRFA